jgi:hypothetical protein
MKDNKKTINDMFKKDCDNFKAQLPELKKKQKALIDEARRITEAIKYKQSFCAHYEDRAREIKQMNNNKKKGGG